jgi:hypothetical protein
LNTLIGLVALPASLAAYAAEQAKPTVEVRTRDFLKSVTVVGELGQPVGTKLEVVGYCVSDWRELRNPKNLHVVSVNGKELVEEVVFPISHVEPAWMTVRAVKFREWSVLRIQGFESGYFFGMPLPEGADPEFPIPVPAGSCFCYRIELKYYCVETLKEKAIPATIKKAVAEKRAACEKDQEKFRKKEERREAEEKGTLPLTQRRQRCGDFVAN